MPRPQLKILPFATGFAKWMGIVGLSCGVFYSVGGFFYDLFTTGLNRGTAMAFGAIVGMPAIFGAFGFVAGAIVAFIVNGVRALLDRPRQ